MIRSQLHLLFLCGALLVSAPGLAVEESTDELSNKIKWATASEVDNFGFDVYRAESEDGPFQKLNSQPIEGGGTTDEPRYYEYVDDTIDPHATYWYYVESIALDGKREQFTPIAKVKPKIPATDESDEDDDGDDDSTGHGEP